jgi:hypothetical protein
MVATGCYATDSRARVAMVNLHIVIPAVASLVHLYAYLLTNARTLGCRHFLLSWLGGQLLSLSPLLLLPSTSDGSLGRISIRALWSSATKLLKLFTLQGRVNLTKPTEQAYFSYPVLEFGK